MTEEKARAFFTLADIPVTHVWELVNQYWEVWCENTGKECPRGPWWLMQTPYGLIRIGWRKRVISIEWEASGVRGEVTEDSVTKDDTCVHAWDDEKVVEYLKAWKALAESAEVPVKSGAGWDCCN